MGAGITEIEWKKKESRNLQAKILEGLSSKHGNSLEL